MNPLYVIYALIILQVLDGITTVIALRKGGSEENPIMIRRPPGEGVMSHDVTGHEPSAAPRPPIRDDYGR